MRSDLQSLLSLIPHFRQTVPQTLVFKFYLFIFQLATLNYLFLHDVDAHLLSA